MRRCRWSVLAALLCAVARASAHSASDAYLTLTSTPAAAATIVHGQWDIALRDLDFVLALDADGDGDITWRELKDKLRAIERYAYPKIAIRSGGRACAIRPGPTRVADHADGAYVALSFDARCAAPGATTTLDYRLFFPIDPSHRAIVIWTVTGSAATAVLSPANSSIGVPSGR